MPSYDMIDGKAFIRDYAKPAVAGLNHLIDGGGIGDFQTAPTYIPAYLHLSFPFYHTNIHVLAYVS